MNINEAFESKYGLPVVRERIGYLQLLKDIRAKKVKEIHWFSREDDFYFEGPCIIEYHDSSVKQSVVPPYDYRIPSAMSSSGVKGTLLSPVPTKFDLSPIPTVSDEILNFVGRFFPLLSLIGVYLGVQYMNWLKGDYDDRKTMRKREKEDAAKQKDDISQEEKEAEAEYMADMGFTVKEIIHEMKEMGIKYDIYHIKTLVERAKKKAAAEAEAERAKKEEEQEEEAEK